MQNEHECQRRQKTVSQQRSDSVHSQWLDQRRRKLQQNEEAQLHARCGLLVSPVIAQEMRYDVLEVSVLSLESDSPQQS